MPALRVFLCLVVYMAVSATKRPTGRPSKRTAALELELIDRIATGEPLAQICRDEHMPERTVWYDWLDKDPDLFQRFARAREKGFDAIAEDALKIANTPFEGESTITRPDGSVEVRREDMLGHRKLQVETRLKLLAKWDPKRYGDRLATTLTGPNDGPVQFEYTSSADAQQALADLTRRLAVLNGSD